jgi:hypothetical protein
MYLCRRTYAKANFDLESSRAPYATYFELLSSHLLAFLNSQSGQSETWYFVEIPVLIESGRPFPETFKLKETIRTQTLRG